MEDLFVSRSPPIPNDVSTATAKVEGQVRDSGDDDEADDSLMDEALQILRLYRDATAGHNLIQILQVYAQKRRFVGSFSACFTYTDYRVGGKDPRRNRVWKCTFQCPAISETPTSSVVALSLVRHATKNSGQDDLESSIPPKLKELEDLTLEWLGEYFVGQNGWIYFKNKKQAQKSAAFAMMYKLFAKKGIPNDLRTSSSNGIQKKKDSFFLQDQAVAPSPPTPVPVENRKSFEKRRQKLSKIRWVHQLHQAGIRKVHILYRDYVDGERTNDDDEGLLLSPTRIVCEMEIRQPIPSKVKSRPFPNKAQARDDAVGQLISNVCVNESGSQLENESKSLQLASLANCDSETATILDELDKLLQCDLPLIHYRAELPSWTYWNASNAAAAREEMLLYEVILSCSAQDTYSSAISKRLNLVSDGAAASQVTRIGMLLPICDELVDHDTGVALEFQCPFGGFQKGGDDFTSTGGSCHWVQFRKPQRLRLSTSDDDMDAANHLRCRQQLLSDFYLICKDWKVYGLGRTLKAMREEAGPVDDKQRHYTFVPLVANPSDNSILSLSSNDQIDWQLMEKVVADERLPYLVATQACGSPYLFVALGTGILAATLLYTYATHDPIWGNALILLPLKTSMTLGGTMLLGILCWRLRLCTYQKRDDDMSNHFLSYRIRKNGLFVAAKNFYSAQNAHSRLVATNVGSRPRAPIGDLKKQASTVAELIQLKYHVRLRHPQLNFVLAHPLDKISDFNGLDRDEPWSCLKPALRLVPELVHVLPMPRDFLFAVGVAERYLIPIEVAIANRHKASMLKRRAMQIGDDVLQSPTKDEVPINRYNTNSAAFSAFERQLATATAVFPASRFERLEFLGDRVLNHFLMLNIFSQNNRLQWGHDELEEILSLAKKNHGLRKGALRAGLNRLIHAGIIPWREEHTDFPIPDSFLSNVVESILGAVYVQKEHGEDGYDPNTVGKMIVGIMEGLRLPMPTDESAKWWFRGGSICLDMGYSFDQNFDLRERLEEGRRALEDSPQIKAILEEKVGQMISILTQGIPESEREGVRQRLQTRHASILLCVALFDANLDGSDHMLNSDSACERLEPACLMRDSIFFVGYTALELELSRDFFRMYPQATPSDLHLLNTCTLTHDVLAYILWKNDLHRCLFDETPRGADKFLRAIAVSETVGNKFWQENDGWLLPGGSINYAERRNKSSVLNKARAKAMIPKNASPKYPGLVGGRLFGSREKLDLTIVDDWQFSFKCMIGSLVLILGIDTTWSVMIRPLLEELMLISPEEYRTHFGEMSSICQNYQRGNTNCLGVTVKDSSKRL